MNRLLATAALALALGVATVPAFADDVTITIHRTIPATDNDQPDMHAAYGMHSDFVGLGMQMQLNLSCQNGGAIHLDDYPLNDDNLTPRRQSRPSTQVGDGGCVLGTVASSLMLVNIGHDPPQGPKSRRSRQLPGRFRSAAWATVPA